MEIAEYTVEVRREVIPYDDWREDPRWDQLLEYAEELFGDGVEGASGCLHRPSTKPRPSVRSPDAEGDWELARAYLDGSTLKELGDSTGFTPEWVRQRINRVAPWAPTWKRHRQAARKRTQRALQNAVTEAGRVERACSVCGAACKEPPSGRSPDVKCSETCKQLWEDLRNHIDDTEVREFVRPGSRADWAATTAHREGLPVFQRLPETIQAQISGASPRRYSYHRVPGRGPKERAGEGMLPPDQRREIRRWVNETIALPQGRATSADHW